MHVLLTTHTLGGRKEHSILYDERLSTPLQNIFHNISIH